MKVDGWMLMIIDKGWSRKCVGMLLGVVDITSRSCRCNHERIVTIVTWILRGFPAAVHIATSRFGRGLVGEDYSLHHGWKGQKPFVDWCRVSSIDIQLEDVGISGMIIILTIITTVHFRTAFQFPARGVNHPQHSPATIAMIRHHWPSSTAWSAWLTPLLIILWLKPLLTPLLSNIKHHLPY